KKNPDEDDKLKEIDLANSSKLAENETEVLKSRNLVNKVVSDLQLWVTYQQPDGFLRKKDLYKVSPVAFKLLKQKDTVGGQVFKVIIKDDKSFYLKKSNGQLAEFPFNTPLVNSFGTWELKPTSNFKDYIGTEIRVVLNNPNKVAADYQKNIDADLVNKLAPTIELGLKDEVAQRGKDVLNDLIKEYNANNIRQKNLLTQKTLDFIDNRIRSVAGELSRSENNVEGYKSSNGLTNISSQSEAYLQNTQVNDNKLNDINTQLASIRGIEEYVNSPNDQTAPSVLGINDDGLKSLISRLSTLEQQREQTLANTPEDNPIFDPINRQIRVLKDAIKENVRNVKSSLLAQRRIIESSNSNYQASIRNLPVQERQLDDKTRQQTIKESLYNYLLQKKEEIALNYAAIVPDAIIVDYAYVGTLQSQKMPIYGVAFLLGLLFPTGLIYARNSLSNRITTRKEITDATGIPVLGELSHKLNGSPIISPDSGNVAIGEEFRDLRTNLHFLQENTDKGYVTLVTSSIASEGKSFVSTNLGIVMAASGKKTIILEIDLRRPKISETFGLSQANPGISTYLIEQIPLKEVIQSSNVHPNLDIIGSGPIPAFPSELLGLDKLDQLINQLRQNYDNIILDTPPINLVTDAKILSRVSDITLYVIRQSFTFKSLLPFIKSLNDDQHFNNMKIVFNNVDKGKYGYNYGNDYYKKIRGGGSAKSGVKQFLKRF
ncbi:MAG: GumC family protein, partial [Mucilaginibacter sp.]